MSRWKLPDFERLWDIVQKCLFLPLAGIILILLLAWSIDSVRAWLQGHGLKGFDVPAAVGIVLAATMFVLYSFQQQLKEMEKRIGAFSPSPSSDVVPGGTARVYEKFPDILSEVSSGSDSDKTLDVLGLTLFTAWPMLLGPLLRDPVSSFRGWRVNVFFLSPAFIQGNTYFTPQWALDAEAQSAAITTFIASNELSLKQRSIELKVGQYNFFPAVHGFRTGAGHLLISYVCWDGEFLDNPSQFYDFFQPSDKSLRASAYRRLFDSWLKRAVLAAAKSTTGKVAA